MFVYTTKFPHPQRQVLLLLPLGWNLWWKTERWKSPWIPVDVEQEEIETREREIENEKKREGE